MRPVVAAVALALVLALPFSARAADNYVFVRTNPLAYRREGDRIFVFGSKGGSPADPDWAWNLRASHDVEVEIGTDRYPATVVEITGAERDEIYARQAADWPQFGQYQQKVDRTIPVFELIPTG